MAGQPPDVQDLHGWARDVVLWEGPIAAWPSARWASPVPRSRAQESFMPGVALAVWEVMGRSELVYGLDRLLGLA